MKSIMKEIDRLTAILTEKINTGKADEIMPVLNERFKLMMGILKAREASNYLFNLLEQDKIIMQKVKDQQKNTKIILGNMNKLSRYKF